MDITGMLAVGNGEKCPFCDIINEKDLDILGHMIENHKEDIGEDYGKKAIIQEGISIPRQHIL